MITISEMPADYRSAHHFRARVNLSSGDVAGEGYGATQETATFWAVWSALKSENPDFVTAGRGHRVYLSAADYERLKDR